MRSLADPIVTAPRSSGRPFRRPSALALALGGLLVGGTASGQPEAPATQPATRRAARPATQPATRPAARPATRPATMPAVKIAPAPKATVKAKRVEARIKEHDTKVAKDPYAGLDHTGTPALPPKTITLPPPSAKPGEERPLPNYDGREADSLSAGETLIWVPRAIFFPAYLVMNYVVRWPLVKAVTLVEKHHVIARVTRLFTFAGGRAGLFPTIFFDFGLNPSLGFQFYFDDVGVKNHNLLLRAGFWFNQWMHLIATDTFKVFRNDEGEVKLRGEFSWRPDRVFNGLDCGAKDATAVWGICDSHEFFFRQRDVEVELSLRTYLEGLNRVKLAFYFKNVDTSDGHDFNREEDIQGPRSPYLLRPNVVDPTLVPGYRNAYNLLTTELELELDTRYPERRFTPGSGLRLELFGRFSFDPSNKALNFFRYGGEAGAFWDVSGINHVLALRLYVELLEKTGGDDVPFTERLILGGPEHMRGFLEGQRRGDSAAVLTLDYRYPIWVLFDAALFVSVGNVFPGRFEDFNVKRMSMSWGLGLRTNTSRDTSFDLLLAFATNRFDAWQHEFDIDHVRFVFGVNQGF